VRLDLSYTK